MTDTSSSPSTSMLEPWSIISNNEDKLNESSSSSPKIIISSNNNNKISQKKRLVFVTMYSQNNRLVNSVMSEIHNVLSTIRLTDRGSLDRRRFEVEVSLQDEPPTVRGLKRLNQYLLNFADLEEIDAPTYLAPFLEIIRSPDANAVVTGVTLSSLSKLLLYGCLTTESPRAHEAVNQAVLAISQCRFESSHQYSDEVVLMQLLEVMVSLLRCPVGSRITNKNVWRMIQTSYRMAVDPNISELLRAAAANQCSHIILTIFANISSFSNVGESATNATTMSFQDEEEEEEEETREDDEALQQQPYGTPVLVKTLRFLSQLINPYSHPETHVRAMGLQLINIALETAGEALENDNRIVRVLQGDLSKFLLRNSQTDDLSILALTLRVVYNLFAAMKQHLKVQLEIFLTSVHFRIVDLPTYSDEMKELALESLLDFCHDPSLALNLHANYDCDVNCSNLFEGLIRLLSKNTMLDAHGEVVTDGSVLVMDESSIHNNNNNSGGGGGDNKHGGGTSTNKKLTVLTLLSLEGLMSIIMHIATKCRRVGSVSSRKLDFDSSSDLLLQQQQQQQQRSTPLVNLINRKHSAPLNEEEELMRRKVFKRRLLLVSTQFNKAPHKTYWREYAFELAVIKDPNDPICIAEFLLQHAQLLDKTAVGECLGDREEFNQEILKAYASKFDFTHMRLDEALRMLLQNFRIPGEAQKIERIMEAFADSYIRSGSLDFANRDAVFIFAFSVIMLHTDAHSKQIANDQRMTLEQFVRNNRGINNGADLPREYLEQVYNSVREREFLVMFEKNPLQKLQFANEEWDGVLRRNVEHAKFSNNQEIAGVHERDMFFICFEPASGAMDSALEHTLDGRIFLRTLKGIRDLSKIACYFDAFEEFNRLMIVMSKRLVDYEFTPFFNSVRNVEAIAALAQVEALVESGTTLLNEEEEGGAAVGLPSALEEGDGTVSVKKRKKQILLNIVEVGASDPFGPVRALLIIRCVFLLARQYGSAMREAWLNVIIIASQLKREGLLPCILVDEREGRERRKSTLETPPMVETLERQVSNEKATNNNNNNNNGGGVWMKMASFLFGSGNSEEERESNAQKIQQLSADRKGKESIWSFFAACELKNVFSGESVLEYGEESLNHLISCLTKPRNDLKPACVEITSSLLYAFANNSAYANVFGKLRVCYVDLIGEIFMHDLVNCESAADSLITLCLNLVQNKHSDLEVVVNLFSLLLQIPDAFYEADAQLTASVGDALLSMTQFLGDLPCTLEVWRTQFQTIDHFARSPNDSLSDFAWNCVRNLVNENANLKSLKRVNILFVVDALSSWLESNDNEAKVVESIRLLGLILNFVESNQYEDSDAIWNMILVTLRARFDDEIIHSVIYETVLNAVESSSIEALERRQVFDRLLIPLVNDATKRNKNHAKNLLSKCLLLSIRFFPSHFFKVYDVLFHHQELITGAATATANEVPPSPEKSFIVHYEFDSRLFLMNSLKLIQDNNNGEFSATRNDEVKKIEQFLKSKLLHQ